LADVFIHEKVFKASEQCLKICEQILQGDKSKLFVVYAKLGYTYLYLKDPKSGLKYINAATMINPESPVIHLLKGKLHFMEGDSKAARAAYHKAMSLDPSLPLANISIYKIHYQLEDWQTAESDLWYERDRLPTSAFVYYSLANFAFESDAPDQALPIIQKAILLDPSKKMYWDLLYAIQDAIQPQQKQKKRK
jgi:tetratricopeptide (TPR) repeat protein